jgi:aconitate hydratase
VHQHIKANFLMSPPLVVAFALAGRVHIDLSRDPLGKDENGKETFLRDLWPTLGEIRHVMQSALAPEMFRKLYRDFADQNPKWNEIPSSAGDIYQWDEKSDYIHEPPFFQNFSMEPGHIEEIRGALSWHFRRLGNDRSHFVCGRNQRDFARRKVFDVARNSAARFQQLRFAPR